MKKIRYICAQPAIEYYTWQVEVMINNFIKNGIDPSNIDVVCSIKNKNIPDSWIKLKECYSPVRFFFYEDTRLTPRYISSVRPHILEKHFTEHPYLKDDAIFYHDCDIIFKSTVDWDKFISDDVWYLSDTKYYVSAEYIKSKKYGVYERMCEIVGIDESIPQKYNDIASGGAQYIMKNVDATFWKKVYQDSEKLYQFFLNHLQAFPEGCLGGYHPIQSWTADMWAVLWNAWYFNHETKVVEEMGFAWPTQGLDVWNKYNILHNAGVVGPKERLFFKGIYQNRLPYDIKLEEYDDKRGTIKYVEEILQTAKRSCLL